MRNFIFKGFVILNLLLIFSFTMIDDTIEKTNLIGTWEYLVPEAPYEYQQGEIIFIKEDGKLTGHLLIDGYKMPLKNLISKKGKVTCETYIQGERISFDLSFKKKSFSGTASYYEGSLEISGHKKKDKEK